jgi:nucleoside-diphosphate-sugar epimerase
MKFIMTGHRGLIGSFLLERLKEQGHTPVLLIDRRDGDNILDLDEFRFERRLMFLFISLVFVK